MPATRLKICITTAALAFTACSAPHADATTAAATTLADSARTDSIARARQDSINRAQPGYVVDSILPIDEELRRFRLALGGDTATTFTGGSASREALARRFVSAIVKHDTADLRAMQVRAREFADLYYPESRFTHPPYREAPDLAWGLIQNGSESGYRRIVSRLAGQPMTYRGLSCDPTPVTEGRNTLYVGCIIQLIDAAGDSVSKRYFGSIIERDGQFKFLSYTNQF